MNAHFLKHLSYLFFFLEGPVDEDLEVDEEEFPNFSVSSGEKAPLQPAPIQHLSQEISSSISSQVSAEAQKLDNMDKTDSVSQSGSQTAPQVSAEAQKSDNTDLVSQSGSLTASQTADIDLSSEQPQHLLDIPFKCDVAPLQPKAPLQPSSSQTRDPLIGGSGEANLSFELPGQEGK